MMCRALVAFDPVQMLQKWSLWQDFIVSSISFPGMRCLRLSSSASAKLQSTCKAASRQASSLASSPGMHRNTCFGSKVISYFVVVISWFLDTDFKIQGKKVITLATKKSTFEWLGTCPLWAGYISRFYTKSAQEVNLIMVPFFLVCSHILHPLSNWGESS